MTAGAFVAHVVRAVEPAASLHDAIAKERRLFEQRMQRWQKLADLLIRELGGIVRGLDAEGASLPAVPRLTAPALPEAHMAA